MSVSESLRRSKHIPGNPASPCYSCGICENSVISDCTECSLCAKWIHRKCAALNKKQFKEKSLNDTYWFCETCISNFPFHTITNDELNFLYSDFFHSESSIYELYEKCKELNVKQFSYKHVQRSFGNDFDNEIDPDGHYYNKIDFECQYYSDFNLIIVTSIKITFL